MRHIKCAFYLLVPYLLFSINILSAPQDNSFISDSLRNIVKEYSPEKQIHFYSEKVSELRITDIIKSFDYYDLAQQVAKETGDSEEVGYLYEQAALNYTFLQQFNKALEYHTLAWDYANQSGDQSLKWKISNNRGVIFFIIKEYSKSLKYFQEAENYIHAEKDSNKWGILFNNIGEVYRLLEKYDSSFQYHKKAERIFSEIGNFKGIGRTYVLESENLIQTGNYKAAETILYKADSIEPDSLYVDTIARINKLHAVLCIKKGLLVEAKEYIRKALLLAGSSEDRLLSSEIYETYSLAFKKQGNFEKAFEYLERAKNIKDSLQYHINYEKSALYRIRSKKERQLVSQNATALEHERNKSYILQIVLAASILIAIIIAIAYNIKRKAENKLRDKNRELELSNNKFISFIEQSSDAFRLINSKGIVILWSKANETLTGIKKEDALGKDYLTLTKMLLPDTKRNELSVLKIESRVSELISSGDFDPITIRKELKTIHGETKYILDTIFPIRTVSELLIGNVSRDDTSRYLHEKELMEAKEKAEVSDRMKSEFLAQMSHEIRTPINTILSFTNLIEEELKDSLDFELSESFVSIHHAGKRIIRTIDMILNMAELQTGTYETSIKMIDLDKDIIQPIIEEFIIKAKRKNISLTRQCVNNFPQLEIDEYSANQIVHNLVDNAIKFTNEGNVDISCGINILGKPYFTISDTGIGISEDYITKLFDAFTQEEQGYTRSYEGNGLGLALVKKYCELNKAEISVKSVKGEGSVFTVTFEN